MANERDTAGQASVTTLAAAMEQTALLFMRSHPGYTPHMAAQASRIAESYFTAAADGQGPPEEKESDK